MVQFGLQLEASVGQLAVCSVTQGTILHSVYVNIQEEKAAIWPSLYDELDIRMYSVEVVKKVV